MNNKLNIALIILLFVAGGMGAQGLEEDPNIIYMKANVLFDSGRYDEAVKMYNRVLNEDDSFGQAYVMRAKTKYALGAYKGTKMDIMKYIERFGVTKEVIKLMSKTELKLENYVASRNYVDVALELDPYDAEQHSISGSAHYGMKEKNEACECWSHASSLGDTRSKDLLQDHCGVYLSMKEESHRHDPPSRSNDRRDPPSRTDHRKEDTDHLENAEDNRPELPERVDRPTDISRPGRTNVEETGRESAPEPIDRDAFQEIEIDESLTVVFGNGLGKRKVDDKPDIFLIADESGRVVIDLCVDSNGEVASAELNKDRSTILRGGIISLALRKSQEFKFFPSFREEQCGYMIFVITAEQ